MGQLDDLIKDLKPVLTEATNGRSTKKKAYWTIETDGKYRINGQNGAYECLVRVIFPPCKPGKYSHDRIDLQRNLEEQGRTLVKGLKEHNYQASFTVKNYRRLTLTIHLVKPHFK